VGVNSATQFALVALLVMAVPALWGTRAARALAFPLFFLFFAVPFGDFLVEPMMEGTADFTVLALRLSGIPVYREGLQFVIPTGLWSVVEACSGVRYLIASVMVGTLFAHLSFRSRLRQGLFVAASIVVPIVANWVRAYGIVMLGHHSGNKLAVGADHLIYGWLFFGIVIGLLFLVGARFADAPPGGDTPRQPLARPLESARPPRVWAMAAAVALVAWGTQVAAQRLLAPAGAAAGKLELPTQLLDGNGVWSASEIPAGTWVPDFQSPNAVAARTYSRADAAVGVWVGYYSEQTRERKLVSSTNVLVKSEFPARWLMIPSAPRALHPDATAVNLRAAVVRTPADPKLSASERLLVLHVYRIAGRYSSSDIVGKLLLAWERLLGRPGDGAVLMFYTAVGEREQGGEVLERFVQRHLPRFAAAVDAMSAAR
jgi:EpsI family protein